MMCKGGFHDISKQDFAIAHDKSLVSVLDDLPDKNAQLSIEQHAHHKFMDAIEEQLEAKRLADSIGDF